MAMLVAMIPATGFAQSATPGATAEEIVVTAPRNRIELKLEELPGGADLIRMEDVPESANLTVSRALATSPGIVIQDFFGGNDQPRIQVRGSGLQQNPVERGVIVLRDGLPLNRADGSYVVGLANSAEAEAIEIYRGYLANRLGANVLGGALNFISPRGSTSPGGKATVSGGSFGQFGAYGRYGLAGEGFDALLQADYNRRDGYRDYNDSDRTSVGGNLGLDLGERVTLRVFASYSDLGFDVAGPLTADLLESDPESVFTGPTVTSSGAINPGPNVVRDRPRRDTEQWLIGSRATGSFGAHIVDLALGYVRTEDSFRFPISGGIRNTDGDDVTGVVRYAYAPDGSALLPLFELTAQYASGSADRTNYINQSGSRGALFGASELDAETWSVNAGMHIPLGETLSLSPSLSYAHATRDNEDVYGAATRPTAAYSPANPGTALPAGAVPTISTSYQRDYHGWSPALALNWRPHDDHLLFMAVSRSFEPPTHDDLLATVNGTPNSSPGRPNPANPALPAAAFTTPDLEAQRATTVEGGWRGSAGTLTWDATIYYSWIRNELLSLRDESGASLGAINADRTRHFGIELGVGIQITPALTTRLAYTYQDFRFHDDPVRGDNRLAGAPPHWIQAQADYAATDSWTVGATLKWVPERTPVDNLNTLFNDAYAVVDLRSTLQVSEALSLFGEVTNLFDETYASSTLIVDQARADQAAFIPGDGRGFFGGLTVRF